VGVVLVITIVDTAGDTIDFRPEALLAVMRPSVLSGKPCQLLLIGQVFLTVSREDADRIVSQLKG
jgi:hypothetical protein